MFNRFFTNWKTSLTGIGLGVFQYLSTVSGNFTWKTFIPAVGTILLGIFAKDN